MPPGDRELDFGSRGPFQPQITTLTSLWVFFYHFIPSSNLGCAKDIFKCFYLALPVPSCGLQHMIVCLRERHVWQCWLLIKTRMFPWLPPHRPRPQTRGSGGFSVPHRSRISDELLPGFRTVATLVLGPFFHISELYPFCYLGHKCSCVAPGKTFKLG